MGQNQSLGNDHIRIFVVLEKRLLIYAFLQSAKGSGPIKWEKYVHQHEFLFFGNVLKSNLHIKQPQDKIHTSMSEQVGETRPPIGISSFLAFVSRVVH